MWFGSGDESGDLETMLGDLAAREGDDAGYFWAEQ